MPADVIYAGLVVFFLTSFGSLLAIVVKKLPNIGLDVSLAFSGGIMLVASFTSLILPSIKAGNIYLTLIGITLGVLLIYIIEKKIPHEEQFFKYNIPDTEKLNVKNLILVLLAIIIHNIPEGMAVGVSIVNDVNKGWATAIAIGIQDVPEGLAVSLPLMYLTGRLFIPVLVGILSGFSEFLFAILGGVMFFLFNSLLPLGLAIAGGAMVYITVKEVFPQVYKDRENPDFITVGFLAGMLTMLYLDTVLG